MTTSEIIKVLKARVKKFEAKIEREDRAIDRLAHKSRRIRTASPHGPRRDWYTDRMQELEHVIRLMEGNTTRKEFVNHLVDDELDSLLTVVGNGVGGIG